MKKLLVILSSVLLLYSCKCEDKSYNIEVVFTNGEKDTIFVKKTVCQDPNVFLNNGCIYKIHETSRNDAPYKYCLVCGVRSYRKIENINQ